MQWMLVFIVRCLISSFCHCKDTSWKGKEDCFPVWNVDKIASSKFSYVCSSVLYWERERERERESILRLENRTVSIFVETVQYRRSVTRVRGTQLPKFWLRNITNYLETCWNFFTEIRHCMDRVVNCTCIARFEVLRAVLMEDVLLSACLFVCLFVCW